MKPFKLIPIVLQTPLYWGTYFIFKIFCRFEVQGLENVLPLNPGIIFASNHTSEWDGILIRVALPFFSQKFSPMYYVSKTKDFYDSSGWRGIFYGGFLFKCVGAYPVYSGKKDYAYSLQHYLEILKLKRNMCIFPEGRRSKDGVLGEAHGGVGYLAHTTGAPVVPVAIKEVLNISISDYLLRRRHVRLIFGKPLSSREVIPMENPDVASFKTGGAVVLKKVAELLSC